jgi:sterol 3beta-glucosyltransferase
MRAILTNLGSLGDIQPLLALASELRTHGHSPALALAPTYRAYACQLGFEFFPIGFALDYPTLQRKDTEDALRGVNPADTLNNSLRILADMLPQMFTELRDACLGADVLVSGHLQPASRMLHELSGIPFVSVQTNHFGGMQPEVYRKAISAVINPFRAKHGLAAVEDPIHTDANSSQLALYAISRHLRTPDPDWPYHYHVTGFFFLTESEWQPTPEIVRFLNSGDPPVVVGFSSVTHADPEATTDLLLEAIKQAGCRAIIQQGWSGLAKDKKLPSNILRVGFVPHAWLFRHAACVVHAGGSGTTAATLRSGNPGIIVPHVGDQPMWAQLVFGLGCTRASIPYRELSAERLSTAIRTTLADSELRRHAEDVAVKIRAEQGVTKARMLIEQLLCNLGNQFVHDDASANARKQLRQRRADRTGMCAATTA